MSNSQLVLSALRASTVLTIPQMQLLFTPPRLWLAQRARIVIVGLRLQHPVVSTAICPSLEQLSSATASLVNLDTLVTIQPPLILPQSYARLENTAL
jgi:hypothetical protein